MNETNIEWCDYSWNPVTGCRHGCPFCYARKIAERFRGSKAWPDGFDPTYRHGRLTEPQGGVSGSIFVCSMADLFGGWVPDIWIDQVLEACACAPKHTYLFLTKNPSRYLFLHRSKVTNNMWFGTTMTGGDRPSLERFDSLRNFDHPNKFISFEPLFSNPGKLDLAGIGGIIIGRQTNPTIKVKWEWMENLVDTALAARCKIFVKSPLFKELPYNVSIRSLQDLPWKVRKV